MAVVGSDIANGASGIGLEGGRFPARTNSANPIRTNRQIEGPETLTNGDKREARPSGDKQVSRVNDSLIAVLEKKALAAILPFIPSSVSPIHLTSLGLCGAILTSIALIASNWSLVAIGFVPLGLFVHWFGDSLDGSLARYRMIERPSFGFFFDHTSDLISITAIIVSFGLSPLLTPTSALLVLSMYLLFSAYTYVKVAVEGVHQLAYGGLGCTEFRLLMGAWAVVVGVIGPSLIHGSFRGFPTIDIVVSALCLCAFFGLVRMFILELPRFDRIDKGAEKIV